MSHYVIKTAADTSNKGNDNKAEKISFNDPNHQILSENVLTSMSKAYECLED